MREFYKIGDVAEIIGVKPYVLRYWETEFPTIAPKKSTSGQRVYRHEDVETVQMIKHLLYNERYSIEGARKKIRELRAQPGGMTAVMKEPKASNLGEIRRVAIELQDLVKEFSSLLPR